jgi:hypothetical protein
LAADRSVGAVTGSAGEKEGGPPAGDPGGPRRPFHALPGAGEGPNGFVAAAIANAIFDATGKQPRKLPFTPGAIRALLSAE